MGLLDQVLGQVIGNMAGGPRGGPDAGPGHGAGGGLGDILGQVLGGGGAAQRPEGSRQAPSPGGGTSGGGLSDILAGAGGKASPLILAILAILANRQMSSGAGGLGSILHDMLSGGGKSQGAGRPSDGEPGPEGHADGPEGYEDGPDGYAEGPDERYGQAPGGMDGPFGGSPRSGPGGGRRGDGGFLNEIGSMLDGTGGAKPQGGRGGGDGAFGGFDDLQRRFEENGRGDLMDSWIGSGQNREPSPVDLEQALGAGTIDQLSQRFGIDRGELLQDLSRALPQVVDGLTPQGRNPTQQEQRGWV